jgi:hypothetical protein
VLDQLRYPMNQNTWSAQHGVLGDAWPSGRASLFPLFLIRVDACIGPERSGGESSKIRHPDDQDTPFA